MKYILIIYIIIAGTSEQMPEWYDSKQECVAAGNEIKNKDVQFTCVPVEY